MESKPVAALITVAIASIGSLTGTSLAAGKAGARAYVECGNPRGPAENVTATNLGCADARSFARKVARRGVTRSQSITLPGWHSYYATVRRVGGKYDMRARPGPTRSSDSSIGAAAESVESAIRTTPGRVYGRT